MPEKTSADLLIELLVDKWGVKHIFGLPGDGINGIMEALRKRKGDVQFIQTRHEEAAAFAAVGYAKFSGRLGVCLATSGPGLIHMMNGLYDAKLDQVPVLAISGMQYHDLIGTFYQQDVDTVRLMDNVAVYSERIMGPRHVENVTNLAVRMALGRRGVAHLGFPNDLQEKPAEAEPPSMMDTPHHVSSDWRVPVVVPTLPDLQAAAAVLNAGKKIAIVVGAGAKGARAEVEALAEMLGAPVAKAYLGKDVLTDDSPYTTGGLGVWGTKPSFEMLAGCDTFLMIGSSFPYYPYLPRPEGVRGVQIDLDPARIGLRFPAEVGLVGDARHTLAALLPLLQRNEDRAFLTHAQDGMTAWRETLKTRGESDRVPMRGQTFAEAISRQLDDDAIICGDSGQNTFWLSRHISIKGEQKTSGSGTLATMASGLPYAIGAQVAFPDRQVVAFVGDGGLTMLMGEIATLVKYRLPVKVFVAKNNVLGLIRWEQMLYLGNPEYGVELQDIDFAKVAEACGALGFHLEQPGEAEGIVALTLRSPGPALCEAVVDPFEPIVPGTLKPEQAEHYAEALASGTPNATRIGLTLFRDLEEQSAEDVQTLTRPLAEKAPAILAAAQSHSAPSGDGTAGEDEPDAALQAQIEGAPERTSGD